MGEKLLSIDLKILNETIEFYNTLIAEMTEQCDSIASVTDGLFTNWSGQQADKFEESFTKMLKYGALMGDSLDPIPTFQKLGDSCSEILKLLKNVQTEFSIQKNRCEEFPQALSNTSYDFNSELQSIVASGQLLADYDQITGLIANLEELISGPCNIKGLGGSQFGTWNEFLCCFSGGLLHSNFASPLSGHNERIEVELVNEYKYLDQFKQSLGKYADKLHNAERDFGDAIQIQISEFASGMDRSIYEVSRGTAVNEQRIAYLTEKSPYTYTPEELQEMSRLVTYYSNWVFDEKRGDCYDLFRNYCVALNTGGRVVAQLKPDLAKLSRYFLTETKSRLKNEDGTYNYDELNKLMETNSKGITAGDFEVLTEMFDGVFGNGERSSVNAGNTFLANCYIAGKNVGNGNYESMRSPVFDLWYKEYATSLEVDEKDDDKKVDTKYLKQLLLSYIASDPGISMQIRASDGNCKNNKIFVISDTAHFDQDRGECIVEFIMSGEYQKLENGGFQESGYIYPYLCDDALKDYKSLKTDLYAEGGKKLIIAASDPAFKFIAKKTGKAVIGALPIAGDTLLGVGEFCEQNKQNKKIDANLAKCAYGQMLDAYQIGGQIVFRNGELVVKHMTVDTYMADAMTKQFESNLPKQAEVSGMSLSDMQDAEIIDKELNFAGNPDFSEFTVGCSPEEKVKILEALIERDRESPEYIACMIQWYHEGRGDSGNSRGVTYKSDFEKLRP